MQKSVEQVKQELSDRMSRCNMILLGLRGNTAYQEMLKDFEVQKQRIDDNWHLISDPSKLDQARITKMAVHAILSALDNYQADYDKCLEELAKLENPDKIIARDYDTE